MAKSHAQLQREIDDTLLGITAKEINAIVRAADGRNIYFVRTRLGNDYADRITSARRRARLMEVYIPTSGQWSAVWPERGDKIEVR